jgi:aspartate oxidase
VEIAAQHAEAVGESAGMGVKEWLFLDRVALGSSGVSPGDEQSAAAVVADFAHAGLAFGDGAAMSASEAPHAVIVEFLVKTGIGFADSLVENTAEGGHGRPLLLF